MGQIPDGRCVMNQMRRLILSALLIAILILISGEILLRTSSTFNDWVYRNSMPLVSDSFRVTYRLKKAQHDHAAIKVAFLGSSVTRDGVDLKLFRKTFPGVSFYNLGGSQKMPVNELSLLKQPHRTDFNYYIYPVSHVDAVKFQLKNSVPLYPNSESMIQMLMNTDLSQLEDAGLSLFVWTTLARFSQMIRFRETLTDSFRRAFFATALPVDFDFFWRQDPILDPIQLYSKWRHMGQSDKSLEDAINLNSSAMQELVDLIATHNARILIFELPGACIGQTLDPKGRVRSLQHKFNVKLREIVRSSSNASLVQAQDFQCHDYAEVFHPNQSGREKLFKQIEPTLRIWLNSPSS